MLSSYQKTENAEPPSSLDLDEKPAASLPTMPSMPPHAQEETVPTSSTATSTELLPVEEKKDNDRSYLELMQGKAAERLSEYLDVVFPHHNENDGYLSIKDQKRQNHWNLRGFIRSLIEQRETSLLKFFYHAFPHETWDIFTEKILYDRCDSHKSFLISLFTTNTHDAAQENQPLYLQLLPADILNHCSLYIKDYHPFLLYESAKSKHVALTRSLRQACPDPAIIYNVTKTALHSNDGDAVETLLQSGLDVNQKIKESQWMLDFYTKENLPHVEYKNTYLLGSNDPALVTKLLEYGANPNAIVNGPCSPMPILGYCIVCCDDKYETAQLLLEKGADPNARFKSFSDSPKERTALMEAVDRRYIYIKNRIGFATVLCKHGANPNLHDEYGDSALSLCISSKEHWDMQDMSLLRTLLTHDANPNLKNPTNGWTPLFNAVFEGRTEAVNCLLAHRANPNIASSKGETPLHIASAAGNLAIMRSLLNHYVDPNTQDEVGETPLWKAALLHREAAVKLLLAKGAHKNITNSSGKTLLETLKKESTFPDENKKRDAIIHLLEQYKPEEKLPE